MGDRGERVRIRGRVTDGGEGGGEGWGSRGSELPDLHLRCFNSYRRKDIICFFKQVSIDVYYVYLLWSKSSDAI